MKKIVPFLLSAALPLFALDENSSYWDFHPIHAGAGMLRMGQAEIDAPQGGHLYYRKTNGFLYMLLPISRDSYFFPRVEYNTFTMDWNNNPKFRETHFSYLQFALTFYTTALEKWRWISRLDYNIDDHHFDKAREYGLFSALLWGRNELHRKWHYHIGALGYTGYEGQMVYPIIGLDFSPNTTWQFEFVFPMQYVVQYNFNKEWKLSVKGRPLKERFRTGSHEAQPRSIFNYSTMGAELNLQYEKFLRLEIELFAGYNFGGSFYIKNSSGQDALYTNVQGSPYLGGNLNWGF